MKTYPKGTTKEQWDDYYTELREFEQMMEAKKPRIEKYTADDGRWEKDMSAWRMACFCDAPNKPGDEFANND